MRKGQLKKNAITSYDIHRNTSTKAASLFLFFSKLNVLLRLLSSFIGGLSEIQITAADRNRNLGYLTFT